MLKNNNSIWKILYLIYALGEIKRIWKMCRFFFLFPAKYAVYTWSTNYWKLLVIYVKMPRTVRNYLIIREWFKERERKLLSVVVVVVVVVVCRWKLWRLKQKKNQVSIDRNSLIHAFVSFFDVGLNSFALI